MATFVGKTTEASQAIRVAPLFYHQHQALISSVISQAQSKVEVLSSEGSLDHRNKGRIAVVSSRSISPQSNTSGSSATRYDKRDRCLSSGLGYPASGLSDRRPMVNRREKDAYQCTGAAGGVSCPEEFCKSHLMC